MEDLTKEQQEDAFKAIETAKATGKITKGVNEVTKAIERGKAKLVVYAKNVDPKELVLHLPLLSKDKGTLCVAVDKKEELGAAAGIQRTTTCVAIINEGEAKKYIKNLTAKPKPAEKKTEKVKEEKAAEEMKEEVKEDKAEKPVEEKAEEKKEEVKAEA